MTSQALNFVQKPFLEVIEPALLAHLAGKAANTKLAYRARLQKFADWKDQQPRADIITCLEGYIEHLQQIGLAASSVQSHISTIRNLLKTAIVCFGDDADHRLLPRLDFIKAPPVRGIQQGQRLTGAQRQQLLDAPGIDTHKGRRDTAMLALMSVCGLRRSEVQALCWKHIGELDGHKVILNMRSKHGRVRTIKLPDALWRLIQAWAHRANVDQSPDSPVFVAIHQTGRIEHGQRISGSSIRHLVHAYVRQLRQEGYHLPRISPHDLRRTAARLARRGGASIEQVQIMLGHSSSRTTEIYIGETLDLNNHAVDRFDGVIPEPTDDRP